jgi:hypothetical protein
MNGHGGKRRSTYAPMRRKQMRLAEWKTEIKV